MKLISCNGCGVVLDGDKLDFPVDFRTDDGGINLANAIWDGDEYVPFVHCPACETAVTKQQTKGEVWKI